MREKFAVTSLLLLLALAVSLSVGWASPDDAPFMVDDNYPYTLIDTLPMGKIHIITDDNGETFDVSVNKGKIERLEINGRIIPATEYAEYEALVAEKLADMPPPPAPPAPPAPPRPNMAPAPPAPPSPPSGVSTRTVTVTREINVTTDDDEEGNMKIVIKDSDNEGEPQIIWIDKDGEKVQQKDVAGKRMHFFIDKEDIKGVGENGERQIIRVITTDLEGTNEEDMLIELGDLEEERRIEIETMLEEHRQDADNDRAMAKERRIIMDEERRIIMDDIRGVDATVYRLHKDSDHDWLGEQLLADGLAKNAKNYNFKLSDKVLKVNGKTLSAQQHRKYLTLYEAHTGTPIGTGSTVTISKKD